LFLVSFTTIAKQATRAKPVPTQADQRFVGHRIMPCTDSLLQHVAASNTISGK